MDRTAFLEMARRNIEHVESGNAPTQAADVMRVPASTYLDPERWQREVDTLFKRVPLMLALGGELREPGSYKAMHAMGVPVLLTRGQDRQVRAFVNSCSHRGAVVVEDGLGSARRLSCPYHAWTYNIEGDLVGVTDREFFGTIDPSCMGLTPLPVAERAGLVFVVLTPGAPMDIDDHLCGYDSVLEYFNFGEWHLVSRKQLVGPNWKVAYDGYLDYYHIPFLHRNTFGPDMSSRAIYTAWGPHQRMTRPEPSLLALRDRPEEEWDLDTMSGGVWTIFPHVSFAGTHEGGLMSQLFPGPTHDRSLTIQSYYTAREPDEDAQVTAQQRADFLEGVVNEEDYYTGLRLQQALASGGKTEVLFGRNEEGGQRFHTWVERFLSGEAAPLRTRQPVT